jgi:hypothetical protein
VHIHTGFVVHEGRLRADLRRMQNEEQSQYSGAK